MPATLPLGITILGQAKKCQLALMNPNSTHLNCPELARTNNPKTTFTYCGFPFLLRIEVKLRLFLNFTLLAFSRTFLAALPCNRVYTCGTFITNQ